MDSLISHPAIQSGIVPFIVASAVIWFFANANILGKTKPVLMGLAAIAAFAVTVGLVSGYTLLPLSAAKKIILTAYIASVLGIVTDLTGKKLSNYTPGLFATFGVIAILWVIWPVISRDGAQNPVGVAFGLSVYVAWVIFSVSILQEKKTQISAAVFAMAMGTAIVSIIGATALYGQLAAPFAAAAGAWLLFYLLAPQRAVFSAAFYLPASVACASLGAAATVYASLPWLALVLLALVPLVVNIPIKQEAATWMQVFKSCVAALIPVIAAVWYTARQSAESSYYG